jgi:hypothetical protein
MESEEARISRRDNPGVPAVLPRPEAKKDVKTAIGSARAKHRRKALVQ